MDFPKTIYIGDKDEVSDNSGDFYAGISIEHSQGDLVAIYTLKEVKKKVTNVTLEEI